MAIPENACGNAIGYFVHKNFRVTVLLNDLAGVLVACFSNLVLIVNPLLFPNSVLQLCCHLFNMYFFPVSWTTSRAS